MKAFCMVCGVKLKKHGLLQYDANSGKPIYRWACPASRFGFFDYWTGKMHLQTGGVMWIGGE